jgi:hypothetical protein
MNYSKLERVSEIERSFKEQQLKEIKSKPHTKEELKELEKKNLGAWKTVPFLKKDVYPIPAQTCHRTCVYHFTGTATCRLCKCVFCFKDRCSEESVEEEVDRKIEKGCDFCVKTRNISPEKQRMDIFVPAFFQILPDKTLIIT